MGVHVVLDIVPERIDASAWAEAFEETRRLVEGHPSRLWGYGFRLVAGVRVPVFTRAVVQGGLDPSERRWCVVGDRATLFHGERQRMYRDLGRYVVQRQMSSGGDDILLGADTLPPPATVRVFGEGEQSEPCQLALLAAATVVETRFPRHSLVSGSFDREQAEAARRWAKSVLGCTLALPVRVDAFRLVERLGARLEGEALARAVDRLYLAGPGAREEALLRVLGLPSGERRPEGGQADAGTAGREAPAPSGVERLSRVRSPGELTTLERAEVERLVRSLPPGAGDGARHDLASRLAQEGPTLTEDAWDWIDREEDPAIVSFLARLAALDPADGEQADLKRALLESRALSRYAAGLVG